MAVAGLVCGSRCFSVLGCFASSLLAFGSSLRPGKVRELPCPALPLARGVCCGVGTEEHRCLWTHRHRGLGTLKTCDSVPFIPQDSVPFIPQLFCDGKRQIGVLNTGDGVCASG